MAFGDIKGTLGGNAASIPNPASCTGSVSVAVGDLIVAICGQQTNKTVTACSDNLGNTYTAQNIGTDAGTITARVYYAYVTVAGTLTSIDFAVTASANDWCGTAMVVEGSFDASPLDANPANITSDVTSPYTCPSTGTLAQADELVVAWGAANHNASWSATSPNLLAVQRANGTTVRVALGYQVVASTSAVAPEFTASPDPTEAILGAMSFRKAAVAGQPYIKRTGGVPFMTGSRAPQGGATW